MFEGIHQIILHVYDSYWDNQTNNKNKDVLSAETSETFSGMSKIFND